MTAPATKTVRKWFWVWDFEKEGRWLNCMAQQGWVLDGVGLATYRFVACEPGTYAVGIEMHEHDEDYLAFMRETGAEYVGRMAQWIYFRKEGQPGSFGIFSDRTSRVKHLNTVGRALAVIAAANVLIAFCTSLNLPHMLWLSWVNLACAMLLTYALGRIHGKVEALEWDALLEE